MIHNEIAPVLSLDGTWEFEPGPGGGQPAGAIQVPGCWEAQGYSKLIEGPVIYRRRVQLPEDWAGKRVMAEFDAVSYAAALRINGKAAGQHIGMWTPFAFDVTPFLSFDRENLLELEVTKPGKRYPMRTTLAGFLPDVAVTFGGVWQGVRLRAVEAVLVDPMVAADPEAGALQVTAGFQCFNGLEADGWQVNVLLKGQIVGRKRGEIAGGKWIEAEVEVPGWRLWSPASPMLYTVEISLMGDGRTLATARKTTGFRCLSSAGYRLSFNSEPVCLRGALHWGWDPQRIAPSFPEETIREEFRQLRSLGFNLVKLCLVIPNPLYYQIADEEGMFLWQEMPLWTPDARPTADLMERAPEEYAEYMHLLHVHPSIVVYSLGCELMSLDAGFIAALNKVVRESAANVLHCDNSGSNEVWSGGSNVDLADFSDYHIYADIHHFEPILEHFRRDWMPPRPWLSGEFCDSDTFRDLRRLIAANDGEKPWWLTPELLQHQTRIEAQCVVAELEKLEAANLGIEPAEIERVSYRQSLAIRKYVLECLRRREASGGYVVTGIRDTPISTSGVFDDLGRLKWTAEEFAPFNQDAVLTYDVDRRTHWPIHSEHLDRLDRANFWAGETQRLHLILSNAGGAAAATVSAGSRLEWELRDGEGNRVAGDETRMAASFPPGRPVEIAAVSMAFPEQDTAQKYTLAAILSCQGGEIRNIWPLWAYPKPGPWPEGIWLDDPAGVLDELAALSGSIQRAERLPQPAPRVVITSVLTAWVEEYLRAGGSVLLLQQGCAPLAARRGPFWREAVKLFYPHPVWERFARPTFTDMQFFGLSSEVMFQTGCVERRFPEAREVRPLLRRLDAREFYVNDYLVEARVGEGRLLACSLRLQGGDGAQPVGLRRNVAGMALLREMVEYLYEPKP
jgi:hypothetical protein